ncbi:MAG: ATP-binding protein [Desulfopila sp.]|jgi:two-component system sensor histidine kinase HydH|nr:ATP-binding protein [Desulfopila sp.]
MKNQSLAKVSPWLLAAACTLLAIIISVFAVSNYQREKKLMTESLVQQGATIAGFVMSSSRASLRGNLRSIRVTMGQWTDHVQQVMDNSTEHPRIRFMALVDSDGRILAGTEHGKNGTTVDPSTRTFLDGVDGIDESVNYRFTEKSLESKAVFQVAVRYYPFGQRNFIPRVFSHDLMSKMRSESGRRMRGAQSENMLKQLEEINKQKFTLLIELDLDEFNTVVRRQLLQIMSLSLVMLLVGAGGWFSLLTLQGLKGSQVRLKQIRKFTDILVSSLPVGLIATDNDGNIRIFNQSAEEMVGVSASRVLGKDPQKVLPRELADELSQKNISSNKEEQKEILLGEGENSKRSLVTLALPVVDSKNRFAGNTLLIQDISRIKNLQRELRRSERLAALGKMAAGVAHELRNPLSSIKGLALLLKAKVQKDQQGNDTADILVREVERLNRSIGELLDYARPHKLQLKKVNICQVLDKAISLVHADLQSLEIDLQSESNGQHYVLGDRDKLNQVFLNLLLNAIQAMNDGGILQIRTFAEDGRVICQVEDSGCGLDEENVAKVFDPYFTTKSDGTGLGLAMSAKIVEEHSGIIEFRSSIGHGTVVKVSLPAYSEES